MVINRVGPLSVAKLAGALYATIGLIFGALVSLLALVGSLGASADESEAAALGAIFGTSAVILLPLLYGCLGFVMTLLGAALYNAMARIFGGVQIDVS
jgi:hypothetical protein